MRSIDAAYCDRRRAWSVDVSHAVSELVTTACAAKRLNRSRCRVEEQVRKVATPLRELTCHMGLHIVACHPAEVTFPPLRQPKLVLD